MRKRWHPTRRRNPLINGALAAVIAAAVVAGSGCSGYSRSSAVKAALPQLERGKLVNTVLFIPFVDATRRTGVVDMAAFEGKVVGELRDDCKGVALLTGEQPKAAALMARLSEHLRDGDIVGFSESARRAGVAAIVTGRIAEVAADERSRGFWWLSDTHYYLSVQVDTAIYDVETGAKAMDASMSEEIKIDGLEYDAITMGQPLEMAHLDKLLDELAGDCAARTCNALRKQPWIGFVTAVDGGAVTLVPGGAAGLRAGMKLHVFDSGTLIDGGMGQRYFVPGLQTAVIEISAVGEHAASARVLSGLPVSPGDSVRLLD